MQPLEIKDLVSMSPPAWVVTILMILYFLCTALMAWRKGMFIDPNENTSCLEALSKQTLDRLHRERKIPSRNIKLRLKIWREGIPCAFVFLVLYFFRYEIIFCPLLENIWIKVAAIIIITTLGELSLILAILIPFSSCTGLIYRFEEKKDRRHQMLHHQDSCFRTW